MAGMLIHMVLLVDVVFSALMRGGFAACSCDEMMYSHPFTWCLKYVCHTAGLDMQRVGSLTRFRLSAHDLCVFSG
jgi:hypothetical protein